MAGLKTRATTTATLVVRLFRSAHAPSAIAGEDVVRQRQQGIAFRARWKRVEWFLGAFGVFDRAAVRVVNRRVLLQAAKKVGPLLGRDGARRDDVADDTSGFAVLLLPEQVDQRQRHLALAQVAANRLADRLRVAGEVEQVVHELKRDTEVEPVL